MGPAFDCLCVLRHLFTCNIAPNDVPNTDVKKTQANYTFIQMKGMFVFTHEAKRYWRRYSTHCNRQKIACTCAATVWNVYPRQKIAVFRYNCRRILFQLSNWQKVSIGLGDCLNLNKQQSIIGINNPGLWHIWWHHQMDIFSTLLAFCAENSPVTDEFSPQRPVTRSFDVFFDLRLNKRVSKQS